MKTIATINYSSCSINRGVISITKTPDGFLGVFRREPANDHCSEDIIVCVAEKCEDDLRGMHPDEAYSKSITFEGEQYWDEMRIIAVHPAS